MATIESQARKRLEGEGRTQAWVARQMKALYPQLDMDPKKLNMTLRGDRGMTASEFLAFCRAIGENPNTFDPY